MRGFACVAFASALAATVSVAQAPPPPAAQPTAARPATLFNCPLGTRQATVTYDGTALTYRYGTRRAAELTLRATPQSNRVFYHRTLYARSEDQTLRFVNGEYSYVVYAHWSAPSSVSRSTPEIYYGGVIVMRGGGTVRRYRCRSDGDMREWPVFKTLPVDDKNRTPAE